jgi:hypothetical protein
MPIPSEVWTARRRAGRNRCIAGVTYSTPGRSSMALCTVGCDRQRGQRTIAVKVAIVEPTYNTGTRLSHGPWPRHSADGDLVLCRRYRSGLAAEHPGRARRAGDRAVGVRRVLPAHHHGPDNTKNVLALAFGVLIVLLVMAGSLWIMANLNHNMMPMDQIMQMQR